MPKIHGNIRSSMLKGLQLNSFQINVDKCNDETVTLIATRTGSFLPMADTRTMPVAVTCCFGSKKLLLYLIPL